MALSIRNQNVETLARKLSGRRGSGMTETIQAALELMDRQLSGKPDDRVGRLRAVCGRCAALPDVDTRSEDEILGYGPDGLTRHGG